MLCGVMLAVAAVCQAERKPDAPVLDPAVMKIVAAAEQEKQKTVEALKKKKATKAAIAAAQGADYYPPVKFPYKSGDLMGAGFLHRVRVESVVDRTQFLGTISHFEETGIRGTTAKPRGKDYKQEAWFSGCDTSKLTDGAPWEAAEVSQSFFVAGTKKYEALDGSERTVILIRPVSLSAYVEACHKDDAALEENADADKKGAAKPAESDEEKAAKAEKAAESKMKSAESLLKAGKREAYRRMLKEVAEKYPETEAGKKAAKLLK